MRIAYNRYWRFKRIQVRPKSAPREGRKALERIAKDTGGGYFDASAGDTLAKIYGRIEDQLRNQYSLGFTSVSRRPGYRKIRVSVKRSGLTVQARDGYYSVE